MKKVAFHNLGCKVNSYELDGISQMFQKRGYEIVDFAQKADIYVINTCTVTNIADQKSRQMISRAKTGNPEAVVVAAGCYVQNDPDAASMNKSIDIAVGNNHKSEIVDIVEEYLRSRNAGEDPGKTLGGRTISDISLPCEYENISITAPKGHTRAFMKIQDGCNQFCSYCAIPLARGRVRSRSLEDITDEAKRLADNGYKEIVLTGIHLSSYGLDGAYNTFAKAQNTNRALLSAIEAASSIHGIERLRLGSLEPRLMTEEFIKELAQNNKICPHFHLSLQSGSDTVLERMRRHYTTAEYEEKVSLLREMYEHPAITTDVIVGFPGESDGEFEETRKFLDRINLYECHVFKYSRRGGTEADKMKGQISKAEKAVRSELLIADSKRRWRDFARYYIGRKVEVLTEDTEYIDGEAYTVGYTPEYVKVSIPVTKSGQIMQILCFGEGCDTINADRRGPLVGRPCLHAERLAEGE